MLPKRLEIFYKEHEKKHTLALAGSRKFHEKYLAKLSAKRKKSETEY